MIRFFYNTNILYSQYLFLQQLLVAFIFFALSISVNARTPSDGPFRIAVIHSYDQHFPTYESFNKILKNEIKKAGVQAEIDHFYLDSELYTDPEELERCYNYIDSIAPWNPDLIITHGDQATFSSLSSNHSILTTLPVVFSGDNFPRWKLLEKYPNVTGLWDKPDYLKTVDMIEKLLGTIRIRFFYDNSYLASEAIKEVAVQLKDRAPETHEILVEYVNSQDSVIRECALSKESSEIEISKGQPVATQFYFTNLCKERGRDVLWAISGYDKHSVFVITKYDYRTMNVGRMSSTPVFSVINEGFGHDRGIFGGYLTTVDIQAQQTANYVAQILLEHKTSLPIIETSKKYVLDYNEIVRWNIFLDSIPKEIEIVNLPFRIEHKAAFIGLIIIGITIFIFCVIYPMFLYFRELKRKRTAQRELIREKRLLSLSLEKSDIYSWKYFDKTDTFIFDKELFEKLDLPYRTYSLLQLMEIMHPDDRSEMLYIFSKVKNKVEQQTTSQCRCDFGGKGFIWYELRYFVNPSDKATDPESIIGIITNIQEFKDKERELERAKDLAAQAELKESFLANMSHEIRTPLNAIVGFSNLLASEEELEVEEKTEFIDTINNNCDLLLKLVNDILELSRIESGYMSFSFAQCDLNHFINDLYKTHSLLIPQHVKFMKETPDEPLYIHTDIDRLNQVITNFISNAAKFTGQGHIKLGYHVNPARNEVSIYVEDTGIGIPEEQQKMIFERFYKQDEFAQGTGLGLSISRIIAEKLGGKIILDSEEGKGSRFTLVIKYHSEEIRRVS